MFERFTERARQVVVLAQDEARDLEHNYIGTEHLLLGVLREEEGLGARALEGLKVTVEDVRAKVEQVVGRGDAVTTGQIPFTPRAKKVLELSLREALSLGNDYIGTEHILLGLVRENTGVAARILLEFDADAEKIRSELIAMLGSEPLPPPKRRRLRRMRQSPFEEELGIHARRASEHSDLGGAWEYKVVEVEALDDVQLNELGADGWELVAVVGATAPYRLVLKRRAASVSA